MAKNSQIKNVLIKTKMEGGKEALGNLKDIDSAIVSIDNSVKGLVSRSRAITSAFAGVNQISKGMEKSAASILSVGKALEKSFSGNVAQTKKIESYTINMEFLKSIMDDFNVTAQKTAGIMKNVNGSLDSSPLSTISGDITVLVGLMQELVEGIDDLNTGSRISNKRMKQVREYIADVGQAADLSAEEIQDLTREFIKNEKASEANSQAIVKQANGLRGLAGQGKGVTRGFSDMVFGANPLVSAYAAIAVNVYAVSEAFRVLSEAANFDRLQTQLASFSAGVSGINVRSLASDMEEASGYALTFKEAINFSTQGTAFNFTSDQLTKLTKLTRKASIALGRDFADSMDRVTKGIAKQEIEVLDEIGVVTKLETAFAKYGAVVGKSAKELTEFERQAALTNEVMLQLEAKYSGIDSQATSWEKLSANVRNATNRGMEFTARFAEPVVSYFNTILEQSDRIPRAIREITLALEDQKKTFGVSIDIKNYSAAIASTGGLSNKIDELKYKEAELTKTLNEQVQAFDSRSKKYKDLQKFITDAGSTSFGLNLNKDTDIEEINKSQEELAIVQKGIAEAKKAYESQVTILAEKAQINLGEITEETGQKIKSFNNTLVESERAIGKLSAENTKSYGSFSDLVSVVDKMVLGSEDLVLTSKASAEAFKNVSKTLQLDPSITSLDHLKSVLASTAVTTDTLAHSLAMMDAHSTGSTEERVMLLEHELQELRKIDKQYDKVGNSVSNKVKEDLKNSIQLKSVQLERFKLSEATAKSIEGISTAEEATMLMAESTVMLESSKLGIQMNFLDAKILELDNAGQQTDELRKQVALLKIKQGIALSDEKKVGANNTLSFEAAEVSMLAKNDNQNERTQVDYAQLLLDIKRDGIMLLDEGIEKQAQLNLLELEQKQLNNRKNAAPARDAEAAFSQLQGLNGLSELQQGGLQIGETLSGAFADAAEAGKTGFSGMIEHLSGNAEAFTELSMGLANAAGSMFAKISEDKVAGLDREIDAEKKRDGKSAESLAKIKKLEAKKIKEQAKSAKAQVIMSTSVAIMRAFQDMGIYGAIPAAIMAGFGAMQISQINSASNGQLAALNGDPGGGMNITGGERSNKVDVSASAQSGEASFFGGTSNKLPGRSGGGRATAGDAIVMGEVGAEVFVPDVPGTVVPAGRSNGNGPVLGNMSISINAIDSASFEDRIDQISARIYDNVENELRARHNASLQNIG